MGATRPDRTSNTRGTTAIRTSCAATLAFALISHGVPAATVYVGTWGNVPGDGRVMRYESGTTWTDITPPGGFGHAVWDLESIDGLLWAATGSSSGRGGVYTWDGTAWSDVSPPGGFLGAATSVMAIDGGVYATVFNYGLYRKGPGTTWTRVGNVDGDITQAIASDADGGRPMAFMGDDHFDEFWVYDPSGVMTCGPPCAGGTGGICSAGCFGGSCIHSMAEHDDGTGATVWAGAWFGAMYRWHAPSGAFRRSPELTSSHVQALASYHGRLFVGDSQGSLGSTPDGSAAAFRSERNFGSTFPLSDMLTVPSDDLLWIGFGGVPFGLARHDGTSMVRTFDGTSFVDRGVPGSFRQGVIALLAVDSDPEIVCDAGAAQAIECAGAATSVVLDGSATEINSPGSLTPTYTWTGPFIEGTADGIGPTVTFAGPGDYSVTLTVTLGTLTESCDTLVQILDRRPPIFAAEDHCVWPPNHRYRCFPVGLFTGDLTGQALDECEGAVSVRIVGASSSQPEDAGPGGDGHTEDDLLFDATQICLRSERLGRDMAGRTYTIQLEAVDSSGNVSAATATLSVPHDQRERTRCQSRSAGLLPNQDLPLGPDRREGSYPVPLRPSRR